MLVCVCVCVRERADSEKDNGAHCQKGMARCSDTVDKELSWERENCTSVIKPITLCSDHAEHRQSMLGRLSVVRVDHSLSDLPIANSSNHCKTDSLKSDVSVRAHTRVSKWSTTNYVIPCQLERDLGIKYL